MINLKSLMKKRSYPYLSIVVRDVAKIKFDTCRISVTYNYNYYTLHLHMFLSLKEKYKEKNTIKGTQMDPLLVILFSFFVNQISKWRSFEKGSFFTYFSHFFVVSSRVRNFSCPFARQNQNMPRTTRNDLVSGV